ncbi:MAG: oxygen-independent coproporphyrinogen III oxidase [Vampirovibrionales bacterium]
MFALSSSHFAALEPLAQSLEVPFELLQRYNTAGPRYTSYPTAPVWHEGYQSSAYRDTLASLKRRRDEDPAYRSKPVSVYIHLPFCESRCSFCSCNVIITPQREHAETYLKHLMIEIDRTADALGDHVPHVGQLHLGGGTPTYLTPEQLARLHHKLLSRFHLLPEAEVALEVDPRVTTPEHMHALKALGFNRVSMGVQDIQPTVQQSINRIQPIEQTQALIDLARALQFEHGINIDLIYGLPHQTLESFSQTLETVTKVFDPDRLALYNFAYVPWLSPHQHKMDAETLPKGQEKFQLFRQGLLHFLQAGYEYIGMDHFAKTSDPLTQALYQGRLHRNFMGYTVKPHTLPAVPTHWEDPLFDMFSFGVSAIGASTHGYYQNVKKLSVYYQAMQASADSPEAFPVMRGMLLSEEDQLRRFVMSQLLCEGGVTWSLVDRLFGIESRTHFSEAVTWLATTPVEDGLIEWSHDTIRLTPLGRIFSRNIAMPFDAYLKKQQSQAIQRYGRSVFSRTL